MFGNVPTAFCICERQPLENVKTQFSRRFQEFMSENSTSEIPLNRELRELNLQTEEGIGLQTVRRRKHRDRVNKTGIKVTGRMSISGD